jgi:hypothetical protein
MKRSTKKPSPGDPTHALYRDALEAARTLKRAHRALWQHDPATFRSTIRKAQGLVFACKPGPKPNPSVRAAARDRARGTSWDALYPKYIPYYSQMHEQTRAYAEEGFRRKINGYIARHPALRRQSRKRGG